MYSPFTKIRYDGVEKGNPTLVRCVIRTAEID
jgi:hypothetical protein